MSSDQINSVVLLGAGNVATHLGKAFRNAGFRVLQVYSRSRKSASLLAASLGCTYTTRPEGIIDGAGLYVIAVTDDAIREVAAVFPHKGKFVVHTSGTTGMQDLNPAGDRLGVFYPLQTFSRDVEIDFSRVPLCLETARNADREPLALVASRLSDKYEWISGPQRRVLHISAVFACNFVNHMYAIAADLLESKGMGFDLLKPLIGETTRKACKGDPADMQTGPAIRGNRMIMDRHIDMLSDNTVYQKI